MTMKRAGRQSCAASLNGTFPKLTGIVSCADKHRGYDVRRGFARLPPRAKSHSHVRRLSRGPRSPDARRLFLVEGREHLGGVALRLDLRPGPRDPPVRVDEERPPGGAPVGLAVVLLLDPRPVGLGDLVVDVGEEGERQVELLAERLLLAPRLRADAPDVRAALVDRLVGVAELAGLDRAAGRVVLRVEVEDRPAAALVGQAMDRAGSRLRARPRGPGRRPSACSCARA